MRLGEQTIRMDADILLAGPVRLTGSDLQGFCDFSVWGYSTYGQGHGNPYSDKRTWVLGGSFTLNFCWSYNYADSTLGVGFPNVDSTSAKEARNAKEFQFPC
jgi:hypothetical protein